MPVSLCVSVPLSEARCERESEGTMEKEMKEEKRGRQREAVSRTVLERKRVQRDEAVCLCLNACHPFPFNLICMGLEKRK